jgi:hypothetical protein
MGKWWKNQIPEQRKVALGNSVMSLRMDGDWGPHPGRPGRHNLRFRLQAKKEMINEGQEIAMDHLCCIILSMTYRLSTSRGIGFIWFLRHDFFKYSVVEGRTAENSAMTGGVAVEEGVEDGCGKRMEDNWMTWKKNCLQGGMSGFCAYFRWMQGNGYF